MLVPLITKGKLIGVLATESRRSGAFGERDVSVLTSAGALLSAGIVLHGSAEHDDAHPRRRRTLRKGRNLRCVFATTRWMTAYSSTTTI